MLNNDDLQKIGQLIDQRAVVTEERLSKSLEERLSKSLEERLSKSLGRQLEEMRKKIIVEMGEFLSERILPQLDDKAETSVTNRLDNRVDRMAVQVNDHENRLQALEDKTAPPVV